MGFYYRIGCEMAYKAIESADELARAVGVDAVPFEASKAAGVRFFKKGCDPKKHPEKWDEYIQWQLDAAVNLREALHELL